MTSKHVESSKVTQLHEKVTLVSGRGRQLPAHQYGKVLLQGRSGNASHWTSCGQRREQPLQKIENVQRARCLSLQSGEQVSSIL